MFYKIKFYFSILLCLELNANIYSQESEQVNQQIEQTDLGQETELDLTKLIGIDYVLKSDINQLSREEMMLHTFLSKDQIESFFTYKHSFGKIISMFELQAIPLWNADIIRKLMKYYYVNTSLNGQQTIFEKRDKGFEQILLRIGRSGSNASSGYQFQRGLKETMTYRNARFNNLYAGCSAEKDIGEKNIFDFTSLFIQKEHFLIFKKIIVGDYLISMGQGLVHWNGYAFGKSTQILSILRQSQSIKPHTSTEENRFFRGAAVELEKNQRSLVFFASNKKIDANIVTDSVSKKRWVTSLLLSGLHRNELEMEDKHSLQVVSGGFILKQYFKNGHISFNNIFHHSDIPIQKRNLPYNLNSIKGHQWYNMSSDFIFTGKSGTVFGEAGMDRKKSVGIILGCLKSLNRFTDVGIQWRNVSPAYNSFSSNIVADQLNANNEKGFYIGINMKINNKYSIETYVDNYKHPFPVYASDGPQRGLIAVLLFTYKPSKKAEIYIRLTEKRSDQNQDVENIKSHTLNTNISYQTRLHGNFHINDAIEFRIRNEILSRRDELNKNRFGWLNYFEFILHPIMQPYSISYRSVFYNTDGYESSIYAMERDLPHYYSMNSFFNRGTLNYILLQYSFTNKISFSGKWIFEKKYYNSNSATGNFDTGINTSWRTQLTIKF